MILAVLWFSAGMSLAAAAAHAELRRTGQFVFYGGRDLRDRPRRASLWLLGGGQLGAERLRRRPRLGCHDRRNWTFFGLVILALLGIEVPLNMGVEIVDMKAIKKYLFWGSARRHGGLPVGHVREHGHGAARRKTTRRPGVLKRRRERLLRARTGSPSSSGSC